MLSLKKKKRIEVTRFFSRSGSELIREESQVILFYFCLAYFGTLSLCILHFTIFWGKEVDVWKIRRIFSLIRDD